MPGEKPERVDREHYWWLTWTWTNLFFSCDRCNDQGHKANYFPLNKGTKPMPHLTTPIPKPLLLTTFDTSNEQPLLLDPSDPTVDPLDHIRWEPTVQSLSRPRDEWTWTPIGLTDIGKATIRILKLGELWEEVEDHLRARILRQIEHIEEYLDATPIRLADAQKCWDTLLRDNLAPESELSAATWCALEIWMPAAKRHANGLAEPRRPGS